MLKSEAWKLSETWLMFVMTWHKAEFEWSWLKPKYCSRHKKTIPQYKESLSEPPICAAAPTSHWYGGHSRKCSLRVLSGTHKDFFCHIHPLTTSITTVNLRSHQVYTWQKFWIYSFFYKSAVAEHVCAPWNHRLTQELTYMTLPFLFSAVCQ